MCVRVCGPQKVWAFTSSSLQNAIPTLRLCTFRLAVDRVLDATFFERVLYATRLLVVSPCKVALEGARVYSLFHVHTRNVD